MQKMILRSGSILLVFAFVLLLSSGSIDAQSRKTKSAAKPPPATQVDPGDAGVSKLQADVTRMVAEYKEGLQKLLAIQEGKVRKLTEQTEQKREMYKQGFLSRVEFEWSERELERARADLEGTRRKIGEADVMAQVMIAEALIHAKLLGLAPLPAGGYSETKAFIHYNGTAKWLLADAPKIEKFFLATFGRVLPMSASGQTAVHDQMKFDHRNAIDVAVHPDSKEGRALMRFLRNAGIPFVAFRNAVPGSSTGAHIHIGKMSSRDDSIHRRVSGQDQ